jgi:dTDP-4-dehydrorhamnose reductase
MTLLNQSDIDKLPRVKINDDQYYSAIKVIDIARTIYQILYMEI